MSRPSKEYAAFDDLMGKLLSVPHSAIKAKLDAEKKEKAQKRQRKAKKTTSRGAFRDSGGGT